MCGPAYIDGWIAGRLDGMDSWMDNMVAGLMDCPGWSVLPAGRLDRLVMRAAKLVNCLIS